MDAEATGSVTAPAAPGWRLRRKSVARTPRVPPEIEKLIATVRVNHGRSDDDLMVRAYEVAQRAHEGQTRHSGEPYITHPIAVSTILAELGLGATTVAAAMLHDTVEDTDYSLNQLRKEFGDEIAALVDGVTKLDKVTYGEAAQAETVRKMVVAMAKDIRVLVIKLADRLHNARTWKFVKPSSSAKKARETLEIYAPLAHRMGMTTIKWELEEISFRTLYPGPYEEIERLVAERAPEREDFLATVRRQIEADLRSSRIKGVVTGRPKNFYSIYQKMIVRGREFDDIYDLVGIRVLVETVRDCYAVLGAMHSRWKPLSGRFKDYIAMPKFNLYQSLHTTVVGPGGRPVEVQIRTHEMHRRAEYGVAAHWKYKEDPNAAGPAAPDHGGSSAAQELGWLRQIVDWQMDMADPGEFLDSLRYEMGADQVYVFTPKGDVQPLPGGSTPVDFAYAVHTEVGHSTVGARVDGRLVPLDFTLENGQTVEIFTSKAEGAGPSQDWLSFVGSPRARNKIRSWFTKERREGAIELGRNALARAMRKQNLPVQRLLNHDSITELATTLRYKDVAALYAAIGENHISPANVVQRLVEQVGGEQGAEETLAEGVVPGEMKQRSRRQGDAGVVVAGMDDGDMWVKLARCCTPVPGDEIVGFVTRGAGVSVHRADCLNVETLRSEPERFVGVSWVKNTQSVFLVQLQVEALDRAGLLSDITRVLSDNHVNILAASVSTSRDRVALSRYVFEMADTGHLGHLLAQVRRIDGVYEVYRVTGASKPRPTAGVSDPT